MSAEGRAGEMLDCRYGRNVLELNLYNVQSSLSPSQRPHRTRKCSPSLPPSLPSTPSRAAHPTPHLATQTLLVTAVTILSSLSDESRPDQGWRNCLFSTKYFYSPHRLTWPWYVGRDFNIYFSLSFAGPVTDPLSATNCSGGKFSVNDPGHGFSHFTAGCLSPPSPPHHHQQTLADTTSALEEKKLKTATFSPMKTGGGCPMSNTGHWLTTICFVKIVELVVINILQVY